MSTHMADIAQMDTVQFDPIDFEKYEDGGQSKSYAPPPEGRYFGRAPVITDESFGLTQAGYLKVTVDPIEIVNDPGNSGYKVRFTNLSAKKYSNREGSQVMDFLRACGINARPKNVDELKAALKSASGRTFQFHLIWEAYNKDSQESTQGWENFPINPQNPEQRLPYVIDQFDTTKRWYANGRARYFVSAVSTQ